MKLSKKNGSADRQGLTPAKGTWWFDVIFPIALVALLFGTLTVMIYSGQRQMRLATLAERELINLSLYLRPNLQPQAPGRYQIVTADESSLGAATPPGDDHGGDLHIDLYTQVIAKLISKGAQNIVVSWRPSHHPTTASYYKPLQDLVAIAGATLYFAVPFDESHLLPAEFGKSVHVVADDICNDSHQFQTLCSYNASWNDWIIQILLNESLASPQRQSKLQNKDLWVSENLASGFPSYILNLPNLNKTPRASFSSYLENGGSTTKPIWAFVGLGPVYGNFGRVSEKRNYTVHTPTAGEDLPLHEWWAHIAAMADLGAMPHIPALPTIAAVTIAYCIFIVAMLWYFGTAVALGVYCSTLILAPLLNALALNLLKIYLPVFDLFFFGLMSFVWVGFGLLSYSSYEKWRLRETRRLHIETADLKGNFISLLSHNLNTPIAKMRGMLGILSRMPATEGWHRDVVQAESALAEMELMVKCVLAATALEEGAVNITKRNLQLIERDFVEYGRPLLQFMGVTCQTRIDLPRDSDLIYLPLAFDTRSLNTALMALVALFCRHGQSTKVATVFGIVHDGEKDLLHCRIECQDHWLPGKLLSHLLEKSKDSIRQLSGGSFYQDVLVGLIRQVVVTHHGQLKVSPKGQGGQIDVTLTPS